MNIKQITHFPENLNAEVLIALFQQELPDYLVELDGSFSRNYSEDIINIDTKKKVIRISRDGIYHQLPQPLFHKLDVFKGVTGKENNVKFRHRWDLQKKEKDTAIEFFRPFNHEIFSSRVAYWQSANKNLTDYQILLGLVQEQEELPVGNPYINDLLLFLPFVEKIRGDKQKIKLVLQYILGENIGFESFIYFKQFGVDEDSGYTSQLAASGTGLDALCCGDEYTDNCYLFRVTLQETVDELHGFFEKERQLKEFQHFFHRYFIPVDEDFEIRAGDFTKAAVIEEQYPLYLDYNTQI